MGMFRAGGITTLVLAALATAALTMFGQWYAAYDLGQIVTRLLFWGTVTLACMAPLGLVVFPLMHQFLGGDRPLKPMAFAAVGGILGFCIAAYLVWRFRAVLLSASLLSGLFFLAVGTATGFIGGLLFEWLVRDRNGADA